MVKTYTPPVLQQSGMAVIPTQVMLSIQSQEQTSQAQTQVTPAVTEEDKMIFKIEYNQYMKK